MNKQILNKEKGITLIALIITIIILVILAAVSVSAVYNMGIVNHAINGTEKYAKEAVKENQMLDSTGSLIEYTLGRINGILNNEDNNYVGKYVTYKNTRFIVHEYSNGRLTLLPLSYPNTTLLSGKYIIVDNKPVSVPTDEEGNVSSEISDNYTVYTDQDGDAFVSRMTQELDNACKAIYERADGKITAQHAGSVVFDQIFGTELTTYLTDFNNGDYNTALTELVNLEEKIIEAYQLTDEVIAQLAQVRGEYPGYLIIGLLRNYITLTDDEANQLATAYDAMNSGSTAGELANGDEEYELILENIYEIPIVLFARFATNQGYAVSIRATEDSFEVQPLKMMGALNPIVYNPYELENIGSRYYQGRDCDLAPVLSVDESVIELVQGNEYQISE